MDPEPSILGQPLSQALTREWLVTDGLGGYASGTVVGPHTRRYHGLLVAPLAPPLGRHVLLAKLEETLGTGGQRYDLAANEFDGGTFHPEGYRHLVAFELRDGVPTWRYAAGGAEVEKRVWMERGSTTTYVAYELGGSQPARLSLVPLCSFRDFHHETVGSEDWRFLVDRLEDGVTVRAYRGATPHHLLVAPPDGRSWDFGGHAGWWWRFLHRAEQARGLDFLDDGYAIGTISCDLAPGERLVLASTTEDAAAARPRLAAVAGAKRPARRAKPEAEDPFVTQLRRAAHQFLVARPIPGEPLPVGSDGVARARTVLAGYHWFGDWGRDTFIALPGLAMATGRWGEARAIVRTFAQYVDRGMLPNRFPDTGAPLGDGDYNTLDATLWYIHAVDVVDRETGGGLVGEIFPVLAEIVEWHVRGTRFGIRVDQADGLVRADNPQLTWMDAKVGDWVVTPRDGKPVEIAALWHHALALMERWARRLGRDGASWYGELRERAAEGFRARFWSEAHGYLLDVVDGTGGDDASLRPNQVIAAALPDCPLTPDQRKSVVDTVAGRLWTPRGLRTLAPDDLKYRGHYGGDTWQRDGAYHQGTVWPWLLGPFVDAHLLVYQDKAAARPYVEPLRDHLLAEAGAGSISEIFDGDPPHAPGGSIAQAWSVSEVFRAWMATQPGAHAVAAGSGAGVPGTR